MRLFGPMRSVIALAILFTTTVLTDVRVVAEEPVPHAADEAGEFVQLAARGNREAIRKALDNGMDINAKNDAGLTVWHAATLRGYPKLASQLVEWGADTSLPMPPIGEVADTVLTRNRPDDDPALVVLVAQDGKVVWEGAYGHADREGETVATADTKFRIGSVTKQFTAAAILKLQEDGKLNVQDKLIKFFPDYPRGDEVTLHHLLTHTSGIHSYTSERTFGGRVTSKIEVDDLIEEIKAYDFDFDPGDKWAYCNSGYMLLGKVIEIASGQSYADYLQQTFFEPLGMTNTGVYVNGTPYEHESLGYSYVGGKYKTAKPWDMSWAGGAGAIYSTTHDMMRWTEALFDGEVLNADSLQAAFTPVTLNNGKDHPYGYGWLIAKPRGLRKIAHNGGLDGFAAYLSRHPDQQLTVVGFSNAVPDGPEYSAHEAGPILGDLFLWDQLEPRTETEVDVTVDTTILEKYVGRYDYRSAIMTVTLKDGQLYGQLTGQEAIEIFPKSETEFFARIVDASMEFVSDDDGKVKHVVHRQNGAEFEAPRLEEVTYVEMSPAQLDQFVGQYSYGPLGTMTIERDGERLMAQLTGQPALEIRPIAADEFTWVDVAARIKFDVDDNGKVTSATHHQGGQAIPVSVK